MSNDVLAAIDGSNHSAKVVRYAAGLAERTSSKVIILYVVPDTRLLPDDYPGRTVQGSEPSLGDIAERIVRDAQNVVRSDVKCEGVYEFGNPAQEILELAEKRKVGCIVVGIRGLHGVAKIRSLGSVARRVVENATVPVAVVP